MCSNAKSEELLLFKPGACVIGVSVGDTFHNWTKKILINSKKRSQNSTKGSAFIPRDIF